MKELFQKVQRIERQYVSDDCIQIMLPYVNKITVLSQEGILFHAEEDLNAYINKYLEDERRKRFPYSTIPTHYSKKGFQRVNYANTILNYDTPYIRISGGIVEESYVVKDNNQAFLFNSVTEPIKSIKYMSYDEILNLVSKNNKKEEIYYIYVDGTVHPKNKSLYPSEEKIYSHIKESLNKNAKAFREYQQTHCDSVSDYLRENP